MTKKETAAYVADMAQQLADLARVHLPTVAKLLAIAADLAREIRQKGR
jgi:hypothetical protein